MPIKKNKISYTLDLDAKFEKAGIAKGKRKALSELIGVTVLDEIIKRLDSGRTPVYKGEYSRRLSKEYREKKTSEGKRSYADMQLTESMLSNLKINATKKDVEIKLTDSLEKKKAFNHNTGDTLPKRQWLPDDSKGEKFNTSIEKTIDGIIQDASQD